MKLESSAAIVTGGASGLGAATARRLAAAGAHVLVVDLNQDEGSALADEIAGAFVRVDVTDPEQVQGAVDAATELGPLRALVNCAGVGDPARTIGRDGEAVGLDRFARIIHINLIGTFNVLRLAAVAMAATEPLADGERGAIVNTASLAAFDGQIGQASYSASKGGIVGMTLPIARDLASVGIRVNTIAPGLIDTPIYGTGEEAEAFKAKLAANVPFPRRLGTADEFASMALELITNTYMNAEVIRLDGGVRLPPR
jgi:NAD(P)-dependent dehydrogenase (short-subunit alcohol dehydrogenase family)